MALSGDEKRIQALFCELLVADQNSAPRFEDLWGRASKAPARSLNRLFVLTASAVAVAAVCSLAAWSVFKSAQAPAQNTASNAAPTISSPATASPQESLELASAQNPLKPRPWRKRRLVRQRQSERTLTSEAALLSNWQSPTAIFLESPSTAVLNSLPQLNQSVKELQSFLPKNSALTKESNQ